MTSPTLGCVALARVTVASEDDIETVHLGNDRSGFGLFGWSPATIRKHPRTGIWYVRTTSGGYPLDVPHSKVADSPYALDIEHTHKLIVYLDGDELPGKIFETIKALVPLPGRDVWLLSTRPQGKCIEVLTFHLSLVQSLSYVAFRKGANGNTIVTLFDVPKPIKERGK